MPVRQSQRMGNSLVIGSALHNAMNAPLFSVPRWRRRLNLARGLRDRHSEQKEMNQTGYV